MNRDYFAELYVAGLLGDRGRAVYFPKRDVGFDFIITKKIGRRVVVRPVQVKGKYPRSDRVKDVYGFIGKLSQLHDDMVLAVPFFSLANEAAPVCIAFCPRLLVRAQKSRGYACQPACWKNGRPGPRKNYKKFWFFADFSG